MKTTDVIDQGKNAESKSFIFRSWISDPKHNKVNSGGVHVHAASSKKYLQKGIYMIDLKTLLSLALVMLFVVPACNNRASDSPKVRLTGEYRIVSGERSGIAIDQNELNNATITISDTTMTTYDKERKETFIATYTLETSQKPWHITMTSVKAPETGTIAQGLVEADHNNVKLIYALPRGQTPTDFRTSEQQQMFVLEKRE